MSKSSWVRGDLTAPTTPEQCHAAIQRQERVIAELRKRLEAAQKDAQRYQWLRSKDLETIDKGGVFAGQTPENVLLNEEDLDEYIDSEMRQSASQEGVEHE